MAGAIFLRTLEVIMSLPTAPEDFKFYIILLISFKVGNGSLKRFLLGGIRKFKTCRGEILLLMVNLERIEFIFDRK